MVGRSCQDVVVGSWSCDRWRWDYRSRATTKAKLMVMFRTLRSESSTFMRSYLQLVEMSTELLSWSELRLKTEWVWSSYVCRLWNRNLLWPMLLWLNQSWGLRVAGCSRIKHCSTSNCWSQRLCRSQRQSDFEGYGIQSRRLCLKWLIRWTQMYGKTKNTAVGHITQ